MTEECGECGGVVEGPLRWRNVEGVFCPLHRPAEGAQLRLVAPQEREIRGAVHAGAEGLLGELGLARQELLTARTDLEQLRQALSRVVVSDPLELGPPSLDGLHLQAGDRTDFVLARHDAGTRLERQLAGIRGALRLTEKAKENGIPLWSVAPGQLVSLAASADPVSGHPFHLRFEGPHSELQVWCRSEEQMDAWLTWVSHWHPQASSTRQPVVETPEKKGSSRRRRPVPFSTPSSQLRGRLFKSVSATSILRGDLDTTNSSLPPQIQLVGVSSEDTPAKTIRPVSPLGVISPTVSPPVPVQPEDQVSPHSGGGSSKGGSQIRGSSPSGTLDRKFGKTVSGWAKKLTDRAGEHLRNRNSNVPKQMDVFTSSLEDIMEQQRVASPESTVPLLLSFLTDAVFQCKGEKTEGIFRISASHDEVAEVVRAIRKVRGFDYSQVAQFKDPHVPAALLKQWLRDLPVPLFQDYSRCIEVSKLTSATQEQAYKEMMMSLSRVHRNVVIYLIRFLQKIGDRANVPTTKMPLENLALVFVPSFLRIPDGSDMALLLTNQPSEQNFVQHLVEYASQDGWLDAFEAEVDSA